MVDIREPTARGGEALPIPIPSVKLRVDVKTKLLRFTVVFEKAAEGGYIARVPALSGCMTQGETLEEAERMARDAIKAYCASLRKHGERVPAGLKEVVETVAVAIPR